jgi:hypothetical protein
VGLMTQRTHDVTSPSTMGPLLPALVAASAMAMAAYQVLTPGSPTATFGSLSDWVRDLALLAYLGLSIAGVLAAHEHRLATRGVAVLVSVGYGAVLAGVVAGLVLQEDPSWFVVLGGPGNVLAGVGFVTWGVQAWRHRVFPLWAALLCGVGGFLAILLAEFGTTVLIGSFWIYLATRGSGLRTGSGA